MEQSRELLLANQIIQLDMKRDELFEELMNLLGSRAHEFLRYIQNGGTMNKSNKSVS